MPELPVFIADFLEPKLARRVEVTQVVDVAPRLRRVRFVGPSMRGVRFRPGAEVEFRVSDRAFRHYTLSSLDGETGEIEVMFFDHGEGPGASWARRLVVGSTAGALGPGGSFGLRSGFETHVLLGDETCIGLFAALSRAAAWRCTGAIEVDAEHRDALAGVIGKQVGTVARKPGRGDALLEWIEQRARVPIPSECIYLAGHTASIVRARRALLDRGWPRRSIRTKAYWADGRRGL